MLRFIVKRLGLAAFTLVGVSLVVFGILHIAPGDPAMVIAGPTASMEEVENIRESLGLNRPFLVQHGLYVSRVIQGDLGRSFVSNRPVAGEVKRTFWNTIELVAVAQVWSVAVAIPLGVIAAVYRGQLLDKLFTVFSLIGTSFPIFFIGLILIWLFGGKLQWFPISGRGGPLWTAEGLMSITLPAFSLGYFMVAAVARMVRSSILEVLRQDYVRTARAKGVAEVKVLFHHALRNAMMPTLTVIGLQFGTLLGGAVVTETIFGWPGMGRLIVGAINYRDFPMVQGPVLVVAICFVVVNLLIDVGYVWLDPRVRYS